MNSRTLTAALGGHWHGRYGLAPCPAHDDRAPSLSIAAGQTRPVVLRCHAGCSQADIIAALRERGLWTNAGSERRSFFSPSCEQKVNAAAGDSTHQAAALRIWRRSQLAAGTLVETYLLARGITSPIPPSLRFVPSLLHRPSNTCWPAIVAAVQAPDREVIAVNRIWLTPEGAGKAPVAPAKMAFGRLDVGAVRLASAGPELGLAEGIETALSAMQLWGVPCWASLSAGRLHVVELPPLVERVVIFADNGGPGQAAARRAADVYGRQGRDVLLRFPSRVFGDWNDQLIGRRTAA